MRTIQDITEEILTTPAMVAYSYWEREGEDACFHLLRHYIKEGLGLDVAEGQHEAAKQVREVWWCTDPQPWEAAMAPWRVAIFAMAHPYADHLGLIIDAADFLHVRRRIGVQKEPMRRWHTKLLQITCLPQEWPTGT